MAQQRRGFRGPMTQRRRTGWEPGPGQVAAQTEISTTIQTIMALGITSALDGSTIARIRGRYLAYLTSATAANNGYTGAFGIGVFTTAAFDAGAASVPGPVTEASWEGWLYWQPIHLLTASVVDGGAASDRDQITGRTAVLDLVFDTKARRHFGSDKTVAAVVEVTEQGTAVMRHALQSRMLIYLP